VKQQNDIKRYRVVSADRQIYHAFRKVGEEVEFPRYIGDAYPDELELIGDASTKITVTEEVVVGFEEEVKQGNKTKDK